MTISRPRLLRRLRLVRRSGAGMRLVEVATLFAAIAIIAGSYFALTGLSGSQRLLTPPIVALLLVANLVPLMGLLVLAARRMALSRARRTGVGGGGRLHVRLVAIFSAIAAVPTLLVVIFASILFQYGVEFWFSDKARVVLTNADRVAQAYVAENKQRIVGDIKPMAGDLTRVLGAVSIDDPRFSAAFAQQVSFRTLSEAAIVTLDKGGAPHLLGGANLDDRAVEQRLPVAARRAFPKGEVYVSTSSSDRVETAVPLDRARSIFLYASRRVDPQVLMQAARARSALGDYARLIDRSRTLQVRFNAALLLVSLLIVGASILIALKLADRLVRPINGLVDAARRVTAGDLSTRVSVPIRRDEVGTLATAFNRMTRRLAEQTGALVSANNQLETRRSFTEAVLSGVSAGIISVDPQRRVLLINESAEALLQTGGSAANQLLGEIAPELDERIAGGFCDRNAVVEVRVGGDQRTLAVTCVRMQSGHVITFDDITQQLNDQRRAAWADVARRIAHEIKNPLTPIQLAAERLQRRYGREISSDPSTFERLTSTIVRQVGDLRRMVDEFSSFARMPKPQFRSEQLVDIARQALFLHEVAHPNVAFSLEAPESAILVCDRRQLGQALTNIVKNAVEAIEAKGEGVGGAVVMHIIEDGGRTLIEVADDGIGLPAERDRITEPYMTTRVRGTGLGLAIVKKIAEEHLGSISFSDRPGGGTRVRLMFDAAALAPLATADDLDGQETDNEAPVPVLTRGRIG